MAVVHTLTTSFVEYVTHSSQITIQHNNDGRENGVSRDVLFESDEEVTIVHSNLQAWGCDESDSSRCRKLKSGEFNWPGVYTINFPEVEESNCHASCLTFNHCQLLVKMIGSTFTINADSGHFQQIFEHCNFEKHSFLSKCLDFSYITLVFWINCSKILNMI